MCVGVEDVQLCHTNNETVKALVTVNDYFCIKIEYDTKNFIFLIVEKGALMWHCFPQTHCDITDSEQISNAFKRLLTMTKDLVNDNDN